MRKLNENFSLKRIWTFRAKERFNTLVVDKIFRYPGKSVLLGGEDGIIRIYKQPEEGSRETSLRKAIANLETKSGPVQCLSVHDVSRFYQKDLIVSDATGMLTVFCNNQILSRQSISNSSINCVQVLQDTCNVSIVCSDASGVISGYLPSLQIWRINLNNQPIPRDPGLSLCVKSLLTAEVTLSQGQRASYVLASDNAGHVFVISQGMIVQTISTPGTITAMCCGLFVPRTKLSLPPTMADSNEESPVTQIALGAANGAVYILHEFVLSQDEYANIGLPIMHLSSLSLPDVESDLLLCAGHFNALQVFYEGKNSAQFETADWINSLQTTDLDEDGVLEVVIGGLDNTVQAIKISPT